MGIVAPTVERRGLMNTYYLRFGAVILAWTGFLFGSANLSVQQASGEQAANDDISVQARGPIHEAYAQPVDSGATLEQGPILPKKPPDPIPEEPPEQKPEGDNVQWIPGYWAWDADRKDYLWVSGTWRNVPADRKWVPGYWTKT